MNDKILLAHGSGGKLTEDLVHEIFLPRFDNPELEQMGDSALLQIQGTQIAFTTDTFVVNPLFFPGGDIGELAVNGTVNDLVVAGARPLYLSTGFVIEEGLEFAVLKRVVDSMQKAARVAGVKIVTGDTKVVPVGAVDKLFINTAGIGICYPDLHIDKKRIVPGDSVILTGTIADHGVAVMMAREQLHFDCAVTSDTASLRSLIESISAFYPAIRFMRDPTRGGVATTLNEIVTNSEFTISIEEQAIPLHESIHGPLEILGLDPLHVANEGKAILVVDQQAASSILSMLQKHALGHRAAIIGSVSKTLPGKVIMHTQVGGTRIIDTPVGELLPRIC